MTPGNPRHGTIARYCAGCPCIPCRDAKTRYEKARLHDAVHGRPRSVDATGTARRLRALAAIGWPMLTLSRRLGGATREYAGQIVNNRQRVRTRTATAVANLYDELSMTLGPSQRTRNAAKAKGWPPPLAWDDETIDDPSARPYTKAAASRVGVDDVAVRRILDGQPVDSTRAEREEVIRRWLADGRTINELDRLTGWNVRRDRRIIQNRSAA